MLTTRDIYSGLPINEEPINIVDEQTMDEKEMFSDPNQRFSQIQTEVQKPIDPFKPVSNYNGFQYQALNPYFQQQPYPQNNFGMQYNNPYMQQQFYNGNYYGFQGNPVLNNGYGYGNQWGTAFVQQPKAQEQTVHVPGLSFSNQPLFPPDIEEVCDKMQIEMMVEQEEALAKKQQNFQGYFNNNGFYNNYYGMSYFNSYYDTQVYNKYRNKIEDMRKEYTQKRVDYYKNLKRLCNNYLGEEMSENELDMLFNGYDYTIPANVVQSNYDCERFSRMVPVNNQKAYADNYKQLTGIYNQIMPKDDLNTFLGALGVIQIMDNLEQEIHTRRDGSRLYNSDSYKKYLRKSIAERDGIIPPQNNMMSPVQALDPKLYPTLAQSGQVLEDGTISITAPPWIRGSTGRQLVIDNQMENHFEENRQRFLQSIYAQEVNNGA